MNAVESSGTNVPGLSRAIRTMSAMFDFYPHYERHFAQLQLVLFMLGMGATLTIGDFVGVLKRPRSLIVALAGQMLLMPLVAVAINRVFGLTEGIAVGILLTSAMPGGTLAKAFVYLAKGNVPLAISLTVLTTVGSLVTVPATLGLLARDYIPADFAMPVGEIVLDVCGFLLTPLAVGMVLGRMLPTWRKRISKTAVRVGFVVVAAMVLCSLASGRIKPGEHGWRVPLAVIAFCLVGMQLNMLPFRLCRWPREDTVAAGIEVTMRNMNLALLLKAVLFPEDGSLASLGPEVLFVILFYAAVAMGAGLPLSLNFRRWAKTE